MMRLFSRSVTIFSALIVFGALLTIGGSAPVGAGPGTCFGIAPTIVAVPGVPTVGTSGPDVIVGTSGPDNIKGKGGDDKICSKAGNDTVYGGPDNDMIKLGSGADWGSGGSGDDDIRGQSGKDEIYGKSGEDTLAGGKSGDMLFGGKHSDDLSGNSGNDELRGQKGTDTCAGGKGHSDSLYSCNETDRWLGKRSGIDPIQGDSQTLTITKSGPGTYRVILKATRADDICGGVYPAVLDGSATGSPTVLNWDYTLTCGGGSTVAPIPVTGGRLTLKSGDMVLFELDSQSYAATFG